MDKVVSNAGVVRGDQTCARCGRKISQGRAFAFKVRPAHPPGSPFVKGGLTGGIPASREGTPEVSDRAPPAASQRVKCVRCALQHYPMLRRSLIAALVVGTVLTLLNQSDALLFGQWHNDLYWRIPLTYCVPFCVASYGALTNSRQ